MRIVLAMLLLALGTAQAEAQFHLPLEASRLVIEAKAGRQYTLGPRGGCYYLNSRGNKTYVDRSMCGTSRAGLALGLMAPAPGSAYIRGPKGGCYTVSRSGSRRYVSRSKCGF